MNYNEKKKEFLELIKVNNNKVLYLRDDEEFSNGDKVKSWWYKHKYKIADEEDQISNQIAEIYSNVDKPTRLKLYDKSIVDDNSQKLNINEKINELLKMLEDNKLNCNNLSTTDEKFSDGTTFKFWWNKNKNIIFKNYPEIWKKITKKLDDISKKQEFIKIVTKNYINIENIGSSKLKFGDKEKIIDWWNNQKQTLIKSNLQIDKDVINSLYTTTLVKDDENINFIIKLIMEDKIKTNYIHRYKTKLPNGTMVGAWFVKNYDKIFSSENENYKKLRDTLILKNYKFIDTNKQIVDKSHK